MTDTAAIIIAYLLDLAMGDPEKLIHPVRIIGLAIERVEAMLRRGKKGDEKKEKKAGLILAVIVVGFVFLFFYLAEMVLLNVMPSGTWHYLSVAFFVYLVSTTIATHGLLRSGQDVIDKVNEQDIQSAREKLAMIVGRDTHKLDKRGVLKATIETISENASDGIIAPMFYFAIGGLPLAMAYKAINTLDSMVGYKNEEYKNFGRASAKLDDAVNYIPARLTGLLIVLACFITGYFRKVNGLRAVRIMFRDGSKHSSPNSGVPEAAMAGALGVQLGGPSAYGGVVFDKPYIGDEVPAGSGTYIEASGLALMLTKLTSLLGLLSALGIIYVKAAIWN